MGALTTACPRSYSSKCVHLQRTAVWESEISYQGCKRKSQGVKKKTGTQAVGPFCQKQAGIAPSYQTTDLKDLIGTGKKEIWKRQQKSMIWGEKIFT